MKSYVERIRELREDHRARLLQGIFLHCGQVPPLLLHRLGDRRGRREPCKIGYALRQNLAQMPTPEIPATINPNIVQTLITAPPIR